MKKKLPIPLLIAGLLFFIFKDQLFKNNQVKQVAKSSLLKEKSVTNINYTQSIDTNLILNNLCSRPITYKESNSTVLEIINFVPCSWKENYAAEKSGANSSYSENENYGIKQMALIISDIDKGISSKQKKDVFSSENLIKSAEEVNAISYQKSSMAGLDGSEIVFKQDKLPEAPEFTFYVVHFETIFKNKYITLSYTVGNIDSSKSRKDFYEYLPIFKTLSHKLVINN